MIRWRLEKRDPLQEVYPGARYFPASRADLGIILLHAYTGSPMDVNLLANKLNRSGYAVLCPTFTGHGQPDIFEFLQADIYDWQADTRQAIQWMEKEGFQALYIFGLSMGGILASWALTLDNDKLKAGGIFNSPVLTRQPLNIEAAFSQWAKEIYHQAGGTAYQSVQAQIIQGHRQQIQDLETFKQGLKDRLLELNRPYFIGQSLQDELIDPTDADYLVKYLRDKPVSYHIYPHNSHVITVNRNRQDFEADLLAFIQETSQA